MEKNSSGTTLMTGTYTYDPLDQRIGSSETVGSTTTTTMTVYDLDGNPYADYDGSGNLLDRYLTGFGTDEYLARITGPGVLSWYLTDDEGSIRDLVNSSGSVIDHVAYDAYGNVTSESSPSNGDRFKFDGMAYDAALGDYYDNARYYDPTSGRFISQDPTEFGAGDTNLSRFCGNDAISCVDDTGLADFPIPTGDELRKMIRTQVIAKEMEQVSTKTGFEMAMGIYQKVDDGVLYYGIPEGNTIVYKNYGGAGGDRSHTTVELGDLYYPPSGFKLVATLHSHPPDTDPTMANPNNSPRDPQNSNREYGKPRVRVPWIVVDPNYNLWLIGPDKRNGKPNFKGRL